MNTDTPEGVRAAAVQVLAEPVASEYLSDFFIALTGVGMVDEIEKTQDLLSVFDAELRQSMFEETRIWLNEVVLAPGARLAILEFGQPKIPGIKTLYAWYFKYVLPAIGRRVSKHQSAYSYLPASVGTFPPPAEFARTIERHGFVTVEAVPLTLGIVYLYTGTRR